MFKKIAVLAGSGAIFLSLALPVLAGAGKAPLYDNPVWDCASGAVVADPTTPTYGFAVVNTNGNGNLVVEVSLKGATANETYDVWVNQYPGTCPLAEPTAPGALVTNKQGNGNAHVVLPAVPDAKYWVSAVGGGQVLRSVAVFSK